MSMIRACTESSKLLGNILKSYPLRFRQKCSLFVKIPSTGQPQTVLPKVSTLLGIGLGGFIGVKNLTLIIPVASCRSVTRDENFNVSKTTDSDADLKQAASPRPADEFPYVQFLRYLIPHLGLLLVAVVSALATAYLNIEIPKSLGKLVNIVAGSFVTSGGGDQGDPSNQMKEFMANIREPATHLVKTYISQAVLTFSYIYSLACVGERISFQLRRDLFESIIRQDVAFFDNHRSGEVTSRLTNDVQEFKASFKQCISQGLRSSAQIIGSTIALFTISPEMTGMMVVVVPTVIGIGTFLGSYLRSISKKAQAQNAKASGVSDECVSNIRTVRAFAMEPAAHELYSHEIEKSRALNEWLGLGIGIFQGGTNLFLNGIVLATIYYGGCLMAAEKVSPGDLMSFLVATQTIQRSVGQVSLLLGQYVKGMSAGARVFEYINLNPTIPISGGKVIPYHSFFGNVEFRNVSFSYPTRPDQIVIENLSLKIGGGQTVALVGTSGGGKSTIASLLERFYDVTSGQIVFDNVDIKSLDPAWLRGKAIGYINQEPVLFATSIIENIRYGRPGATDQEVFEAAKAANAHTFIENFPHGYQTVVGERGVTVSGGQKQRIAIARALLKNPSILILDEATSALDAESELLVQEALDTLCKGRTVLVIAHRLSTIKNADLIAVISHGRIVEMGNHATLKKAGGVYSKLIKNQETSK